MTKTITEDDRSEADQPARSLSAGSVRPPAHFTIHKPGVHFESFCGICNLFPGVLLIAFAQILGGSVLLTLVLTHEESYNAMFNTTKSISMSTATGAVLSTVIGAGSLLLIVALTENCRAMLIYLLVAFIVLLGIVTLALTKIALACMRFVNADKIKDEQARLGNLACSFGLSTFLFGIFYFFSFMVVMSFYHFRYVRRAILLHEAECE